MWTTIERDNACSEFDGVVYKRETFGGDGEQCTAIITEIWEAKVGISPALHIHSIVALDVEFRISPLFTEHTRLALAEHKLNV